MLAVTITITHMTNTITTACDWEDNFSLQLQLHRVNVIRYD